MGGQGEVGSSMDGQGSMFWFLCSACVLLALSCFLPLPLSRDLSLHLTGSLCLCASAPFSSFPSRLPAYSQFLFPRISACKGHWLPTGLKSVTTQPQVLCAFMTTALLVAIFCVSLFKLLRASDCLS